MPISTSSSLPTISLPPLSVNPQIPLRVSPTDVSQFIRLEQCQRYLRLRLTEHAGNKRFMEDSGVTPQRLNPLLSLSGSRFEDRLEADLKAQFATTHFGETRASHDQLDNDAFVAAARDLAPSSTVVLFQPRLEVALGRWVVRGDVDLVRLKRRANGALEVFITDMKSTTEAKVEHRLQLAFYHRMIEALLTSLPPGPPTVRTGVLFRPPADPADLDPEQLRRLGEAAREQFGLEGVLLEVVDDPGAYLRAADDLALGADSLAERVAAASFDEVPFALGGKCDGCQYNEFCLKWCAEREDLSLLPFLSGTEKQVLQTAGVRTVTDLAELKELAPDATELTPSATRERLARRLAATWPVGPRVDELVHRARAFRRFARKAGVTALSYIPGRGTSTLPQSRPDLNPNLVTVYLDAQADYLQDRVYLLGALVVAHAGGQPVRRASVIRMTAGPPETSEQERALFVEWTQAVVKAVVEIAEGASDARGKKAAPLHVVFHDRREQTALLEGLARNFPPILAATPPLYDFITQLAAYDTPVATYLDEEVRQFKNFPMLAQSLQSVATYLRFDWSSPLPFRDIFKARLFDYAGKMEIGGQEEWVTKRSRFSSLVPLEYAYAAWGQLPPVPAKGRDPYQDFRGVTADQLKAFQGRRLEAMEHVAVSFLGNPLTDKTPFVLPDLATFQDKAATQADALAEFLAIERHVFLGDWKATRHAPPERRVLMGQSLLVRYVPEDQEPGVAAQVRDHRERQAKYDRLRADHQAANTGKAFRRNKQQMQETEWSAEGLTVRLRLELAGLDCDLHDALYLSDLRPGDHLVLYARWATDGRKPEAERESFTPTPKQLLYGTRCELERVAVTARDGAGRATAAVAEVTCVKGIGGDWSRGYVFPGIPRPLEDGELYTLDPCPNDIYGYWCSQVVEGLRAGEPHTLHDWLDSDALPPARSIPGDGQSAFLAGLDAFRAAGHLHGFEPGKRAYIGAHAADPMLLVQGPPGTGKSYSTAFAVLARVQDAMRAGRECRVILSCKTHAATDVLAENVRDVLGEMRRLAGADPVLFDAHFDRRLLELPLYRVAPKSAAPDGVTPLEKDSEKQKGEPLNADVLTGHAWVVAAVTPGGVHQMIKAKWDKKLFGQHFCDLLVLDEASQMNLPEALMAALPLRPDGRLVVVGDHRQMPPIVQHDWERELRRTFREYSVYESLFDALRKRPVPVIRFEESFRLHAAMAEFLRQEVYRHDGINFHSNKRDRIDAKAAADDLVAAALRPEYPLTVIVHDEAGSQTRNEYEQALVEPIVRLLAAADGYALDAEKGLGVVVPHRAQRAALQEALPELTPIDSGTGLPSRSAIDTVERFQGGERTVILVGATESERQYLLECGEFLYDPRRLTVALSRAKRKLILVAARSVFTLFSPDEETFAHAQLWRNLLDRACPVKVWEGERLGRKVAVYGGPGAELPQEPSTDRGTK